MWTASLVQLCLPDPPTPTSRPFPPGILSNLGVCVRAWREVNTTEHENVLRA